MELTLRVCTNGQGMRIVADHILNSGDEFIRDCKNKQNNCYEHDVRGCRGVNWDPAVWVILSGEALQNRNSPSSLHPQLFNYTVTTIEAVFCVALSLESFYGVCCCSVPIST